MANPKHAAGYSQMWWNLLEAFAKQPDGFQLFFEDKADAEKIRFTFYAFREAVKRSSVKDKDPELHQQCVEALPIITNIKMLLKRETNGQWVLNIRPSKQIINPTEQALNGQLMTLLAASADDEGEVSSFDTSDVGGETSSLSVLGLVR